MNFRIDINALRAISVLSVFLYHLRNPINDMPLLSGGFLGVDIFFVISGFLISKIINDEIERTKKFNISAFYLRRFRRIFPAFFVMLLIVTFFSSGLLNLSDKINTFLSGISSIFFVSNLYFWLSDIGYAEAEGINIFLHTWSLSVEEQFYIVLPLFLLFISVLNRKFTFLLLFFTFSFFVSIYLSNNYSNFNFFNPISRFWEFLFGTFLAIYKKNLDLIKINDLFKNILILISLSFIFLSFFTFEDSFKHPGLITLPVIFCCSLIICLFKNDLYIAQIFKLQIIQQLGSISYSFYLWHFPIIIILSIFYNFNIIYLLIISFSLTYFLSLLSYKFIENPFRDNKKISNKILCIFTILLLLVYGLFSFLKFPFNYDFKEFEKEAVNDVTLLLDQNAFSKSWHLNRLSNNKTFSKYDKNNIFIVGNSHATDVYNVLANSEYMKNYNFAVTNPEKKYNEVQNYRIDCFLDFLEKNRIDCRGIVFKNIDETFERSSKIILASRYLENDLDIVEKIIYLLKQKKKEVIIFSNANEYLSNDHDDIPLKKFIKINKRIPNELEKFNIEKETFNSFVSNKRVNTMNKNLKRLAESKKVKFVDRSSLGCVIKQKRCNIFDDEGQLIIFDYGHLTFLGAKWISKQEYLKGILEH